jgi:hypothetical protein
MSLNLSNSQIAKELGLNRSDDHSIARGYCKKKPDVKLRGEAECDEVYIVAGHKGNPYAVAKKERKPRRNRLRGGTLKNEKPPVFGMIQRGGEVVIRMMENVQIVAISPVV